jgi:hypothetical protein
LPDGSRNLAVISGASAPIVLHNFAAVGDDRSDCVGHALNHDVNQETWLCGGHPGATHFAAGCIVKRCAAITAFPDVPGKTCR